MLHVLVVLVIEHCRVIVFVHVALRRHIRRLDIHLGQPFLLLLKILRLLFLLFLSSFCFSFSFLFCLYLSKLIEYVLIVEESVGELFFKDISLEESCNPVFKYRNV